MHSVEQTVTSIMDETIEALSRLDYEHLQSLDERIQFLGDCDTLAVISPALLEKRQTLQYLLSETHNALKVLDCLHSGSKGGSWEL
jgi:hypothetical protein